MKKSKPKKTPQLKPKPVSNNFMVSDAQVKAGEQGYDNGGAFGIGMIKGK
jgi:hypothetical protein